MGGRAGHPVSRIISHKTCMHLQLSLVRELKKNQENHAGSKMEKTDRAWLTKFSPAERDFVTVVSDVVFNWEHDEQIKHDLRNQKEHAETMDNLQELTDVAHKAAQEEEDRKPKTVSETKEEEAKVEADDAKKAAEAKHLIAIVDPQMSNWTNRQTSRQEDIRQTVRASRILSMGEKELESLASYEAKAVITGRSRSIPLRLLWLNRGASLCGALETLCLEQSSISLGLSEFNLCVYTTPLYPFLG